MSKPTGVFAPIVTPSGFGLSSWPLLGEGEESMPPSV